MIFILNLKIDNGVEHISKQAAVYADTYTEAVEKVKKEIVLAYDEFIESIECINQVPFEDFLFIFG